MICSVNVRLHYASTSAHSEWPKMRKLSKWWLRVCTPRLQRYYSWALAKALKFLGVEHKLKGRALPLGVDQNKMVDRLNMNLCNQCPWREYYHHIGHLIDCGVGQETDV